MVFPFGYPVKNLSSQLTHWELTWNSWKAHLAWVTVSSFWGHLSCSKWTHKMSLLWDCCELSVSLQHSQLANCYLAWWVIRWYHEYLTASSRCEFEVFCFFFQWLMTNTFKQQKARSNLTAWVVLWIDCVVTEYPQVSPPWDNSGKLSLWVWC